ncbi:MAG TPA: hypothetical protein VGM05_32290 [Planctomycetaceae bacterium]|jgi:flagellar M-ring protein FliF
MESLRRTLAQFQEQFNNMAPSARLQLVVIPLLVLAGLGMVMYYGASPAEEALLMGKVFSAEELKNAEAALRKVALGQFRIDGQKIMVPKTEAARYNAALLTSDGGMPDNFGKEFDRALDPNPFMIGTGAQRGDRMDLARAQVLTKMIKAISYVEDAQVVWFRAPGRSFNAAAKMTALLTVKTRSGHELTSERSQTLRQAVAGCFGMQPTDVTVLDSRTGRAPRLAEPNDPFNNGYLQAVRDYTNHYQQLIAEALKDIPNVLVAVNPDIDPITGSTEQERKFDAKAFPYRTREESQKEDTNETAPNSEPGVKANTPVSQRQQATVKNSRSNEKTTTATDSVPTSTRLLTSDKVGLTPKSVQATVSIPKDYYRDVLIKLGVDESDKTAFQARMLQVQSEKEKEIGQRVARLLPVANGANASDAVTVSSYDRLETAEASTPASIQARVGEAVADWGGPIGLSLFALWALWMLNRSMKRTAEAAAESARPVTTKAVAGGAPQANEDDEPPEMTKRDQLQGLVKDNPEMAAAVIGRWLAPPK